MVEYKKQHYVPQFYLRQFSHDGKKVYVYNLSHKKAFLVKINNICQEGFFYCDDSELEKSLGKIEVKQARVIAEVIRKSNVSSIKTKDNFYLLLFILMQYSRTKKSKEHADDCINAIFDTHLKPLMKESNDLIDKGIRPEFIDSLKLEVERPHLIGMYPAMLGVDLIRDLGMVLIHNLTDLNFITSDAPCCLYNYIKSPSMLGFQSPGLLIFCPLNDKMLLLLFDPELYHLKLNEESIIPVRKPSDIDAINKLQIHNCSENLIFSEKEDENHLNQLHGDIENKLNKCSTESISVSEKYLGNGEYAEITNLYRTPIDYTLKLSFLKLNHSNNRRIKGGIRKLKKSGEPITPCRGREICEIVDKRIEKTRKRIEEQNRIQSINAKNLTHLP